MEYAIGIVTYQPDITRLQENLKAAKDQGDQDQGDRSLDWPPDPRR